MAANPRIAAGRRVAFASEIPITYADVAYTVFLPEGPKFDSGLYGPVIDDVRARVVQIIRALIALPEQQALALGSAIRMRNAACCLVESDYSSAYGLLVAAIEALSGTFRGLPTSWEAWDEAEGWDIFMTKELSLSEHDAEKLRQRLLKDKHLRLRLTFIEYIVTNLSPSFWEEHYLHYVPSYVKEASGFTPQGGEWKDLGPMSTLISKDLASLRKRLGSSYNARSTVFHQSSRLEQMDLLPIPETSRKSSFSKVPLSFGVLRRIVDHLLWNEVEKGAHNAPELPAFEVRHRKADGSA
jgi:hypothetical protein